MEVLSGERLDEARGATLGETFSRIGGSAAGIARATAVTGGVITSAGVIFAASMFAMMAGSVLVMLQAGFAIGFGLLLDTFVVRSMLVPALATLLGTRLWWPQKAPDTTGPAASTATAASGPSGASA